MVIDYRSVVSPRLLPEFGELQVEEITSARIEAWRASLGADRPLPNRTRNTPDLPEPRKTAWGATRQPPQDPLGRSAHQRRLGNGIAFATVGGSR
jgi:hypothetical protein